MTEQCPAPSAKASILAFDCAVTGMGVAVVRGGEVLARHRDEARDQAATLLPAIDHVLQRANVSRPMLSMIAVTIGPGSFTGVRVGLAAARGLALALGVPLAGLSTTAVLLAQVRDGERLSVAGIDSRLGDWFCALDEGDRAPFLASTDVISERLKGRPCVVVGPQALMLAKALPDAIAQQEPIDPAALAKLAMAQGCESWQARNRVEGLPRPLYLRGVNVTTPDGQRRTVE